MHPHSSFLYRCSVFCTLVLVLGFRNIRQKHPFGNRPPTSRRHCLPDKKYFRIIFRLPFHDLVFWINFGQNYPISFFAEIISENFPLGVAVVSVSWWAIQWQTNNNFAKTLRKLSDRKKLGQKLRNFSGNNCPIPFFRIKFNYRCPTWTFPNSVGNVFVTNGARLARPVTWVTGQSFMC